MLVIDINTKEVIEEKWPDIPIKFWTTKAYWFGEERKAELLAMKEYEEKWDKIMLYGEVK